MENLSIDEMEKIEGGSVPVMAVLCGGNVAMGMGEDQVANYIIAQMFGAAGCIW